MAKEFEQGISFMDLEEDFPSPHCRPIPLAENEQDHRAASLAD